MALPEGSYTQTAYVCKNLEAAAARWTKTTGAGPWFISEPEKLDTLYRGKPAHDSYRVALGFLGSAYLELVQPTDDEPSIFNEVLHKRGEGFHHINPPLAGATFDERCLELERRGLQSATTNEIVGMGRFAFYDALDAIGGFIEVSEPGNSYALISYLADLHLAWDGRDPIRQIETLVGKF